MSTASTPTPTHTPTPPPAPTSTPPSLPATALITGASQGLGRALASQLARAGVRVVLVARHAGPLFAVVDRLRDAGHEAHGLVADVADKAAIHRLSGAAAALVGPIELLVNNASTLGPVPLRPLLETDCEDLEAALQTNVVGAFRLAKAVAGAMVLQGQGMVVNISSDAAVEAYPTWGAYGASKAALDHLTRIWAEELVDTGVQLLAVDPGEMRTAMHRAAIPDADEGTLQDPADVAARLIEVIGAAWSPERPTSSSTSNPVRLVLH